MTASTIRLSVDNGDYRRLYQRGRTLATAATKAYGTGRYAEAARLARECAQIAAVMGDLRTQDRWTERAEFAEGMVGNAR